MSLQVFSINNISILKLKYILALVIYYYITLPNINRSPFKKMYKDDFSS